LPQDEFSAALGYASMLCLAKIEDAETIAAIPVYAWQIAYEGIVPAQFLASLSIQERANMWRTAISEQRCTVILAIAPHGEVGFIPLARVETKTGRKRWKYTLSTFCRNSGIKA
jgi:hypothetical protein